MSAHPTFTIQKYEDNGRLFVKAFLLDGSTNINHWGIAKESLRSRIGTFIGRPLVLYKNAKGEYDHPYLGDPRGGDTVGHALQYQDVFRIGTIIDVTEKNGAYSAIIEVTDPGAKEAIKNKEIPFYVSPAIHKRIATEPENAISDWIGLHLAAVSDPAYTVKKATLSEQCSGDTTQCLLQLRKAHVEEHGETCGFCTKAALNEIGDRIVGNQSTDGFSSQEVIKTNSALSLENTESKAKIDSPVAALAVNTNEIDKLKTENESLRSEIASKTAENDALKASTKEIAGRVASLEQERRHEKIASIITTDIIADEKSREEAINKFVASNLPIEELSKTFEPVVATIRKASVDSGNTSKPKFDQYSKDGIRTASATSSAKPTWLRAMELTVR